MDKDLQSIQEVRDLVQKAKQAQSILAEYSQFEVDRLVALMAEYGYRASRELAELAHEESGFGSVESKVEKNIFATRDVYRYIKDIPTVGFIHSDPERGVYEVATPMGIVAAVIPITNPTSTALFKILIAIKARCTIILSPHPKGVKCTLQAASVMQKAAQAIGAPDGLVGCLTIPTMLSTQELMKHPDIAVILATGGSGLVHAAYTSGKPAIGVGPGNVPVFIERTADIPHAVRCLVVSQDFDWGTICSSEQSIIVDQPVYDAVLAELKRQGAYICNDTEINLLEKLMPSGNGINSDLVGQSPAWIAKLAGFQVPDSTTILIARQAGVGNKFPLSREKLSPILALYVEDGWKAACERCFELLRYGGMGHTLAIHSCDKQVITWFALHKPASRILVNVPTSQGGVGYATHLAPSFTLGCGALGGNASSDNITCRHLLNIKRIAFGIPQFFKDLKAPSVTLDIPEPNPNKIDPFAGLPDPHRQPYIGPHNQQNI